MNLVFTDEMNLFAPQSIQAKVELLMLSNLLNNVISPKDSSPVIGLVQDTLIGLYYLSLEKNIKWNDVTLLLSTSSKLNEIINKEINYKKKSYSGNELISMFLPDTMNLKYGEVEIINGKIKENSVLIGDIFKDKKGNILHYLSLVYDNNKYIQFIDDMQRISNMYLYVFKGFTIGINDFRLERKMNEELEKERLQKVFEIENLITNAEKNKIIDRETFEEISYRELDSIKTNQASYVKKNLTGENNMFVMSNLAKSKGKDSNIGFTMTCLGQTAFQGKLIQYSTNKRTLPYFSKNDDTPASRGFIFNNYSNGLKVSEFFYHNLDGRQGIIDTAIKSVTGESEIHIIENNESKIVRIGDWIDSLLEKYSDHVEIDDSENEYREEYRLLSNTYIPSTDVKGKVYWSKISGITRHKTSDILYRIETRSGRQVTVSDSHSLLIWNNFLERFVKLEPYNVKVGDKVPVTKNLDTFSTLNKEIGFSFGVFKLNEINALFLSYYFKNGSLIDRGITLKYENKKQLSFIESWCINNELNLKIKYYKLNFTVEIYSEKVKEIIYKVFDIDKDKLHPYILNCDLNFLKVFLKNILNRKNFDNNIIVKSSSERLVNDINICLSKFKVFGYIKNIDNKYILEISNYYKKILKNKLNIKDGLKSFICKFLCDSKYLKFESYNDVVLDEIISIEKIIAPKSLKLYDLTVPLTLNFSLANGLHVVDTGDTGYVQRKIIKAAEDIYVAYDNTLRNGCDEIVQFMYAGNGFDVTTLNEVKCNLLMKSVKELRSIFKDKYICDNIISLRNELSLIIFRCNSDRRYISNKFNIPFLLSHILLECSSKGNEVYTSKEVFEKINEVLNPINTKISCISEENIMKFNDVNNYFLIIKFIIIDHLQLYKKSFNKNYIDNVLQKIQYHIYKNIIQPGEMIGITSAQSIGEPLTQFTLDTFHSTGSSSAVGGMDGIKRFIEIMNITKTQKVPLTTIYMTDEYKYEKDNAEQLSNKLKYIKFEDLIESYDIIYDKTKERMKEDNIKEDTKLFIEKQNKIGDLNPYTYRIVLSKESLYDEKVSLIDIKLAILKFFESCNLKITKKKYKLLFSNLQNVIILSNSIHDKEIIIHIRLRINEDNINLEMLKDIFKTFIKEIHIKGLEGIEVVSYEDRKIYELNDNYDIIENTEYVILTKGINLDKLFLIHGIDKSRTITNDVQLTYRYYGIEAARILFIKEIIKIFEMGGHSLNEHHLTIIGDLVTKNGILTSVNRYGLNKLDNDPLSKASFEQTMTELIKASIYEDKDYLRSVSSRIMTGKTIKGGTGLIDIILDIDKLQSLDFGNNLVDNNINKESKFTETSLFQNIQ